MANTDRADNLSSPLDTWPSPAIPEKLTAMSSASPVEQYGNNPGGSGYDGSGQSDNGKSPLSMSLGFLKNLTEKKTTRGMSSC